ncbi:MAG TPA: VWA domain-containing protein, partial [Rhizomicrobium sp.]|nr:VWA domain-containing protein [Rhizomicrobium sp.]
MAGRSGGLARRSWLTRAFAAFAASALIFVGFLQEAGAAPALQSKLSVERSSLYRGETRTLYVLVHFNAPELDLPPSARPPLNLSLVLDRSGSMADKGKMEYLKQAAKMAVSQLGGRDTISVVEFDDQITLMWQAGPAGDKSRLLTMIDNLSPRGSTNIAGGLTRGIGETHSGRDRLKLGRDTLDRVILLSDGLANTGVTDPGAIAHIAADARRDGIHVSSIGLGLDYNEDLMQAVAEAGGGKYYYVESPVQLASIFQQELKSAFATRARDVHLSFHGNNAVKRAEMIGFAASNGRDVTADWPDFYAGEERSVMLRLEVDARKVGALSLGDFHVAWRDAQSGASGTVTLPIRVDVTNDEAIADKSLNHDVAAQAALAESERGLAANVKLAGAGKTSEARAANAAIIADLKKRNSTLNDERLSRKIEALNVEQDQISNAAASPVAMQAYQKASKQRLYNAKSGRRSGDALQLGDKG